MKKKVAIYGRVSTSGQSTDIQLQECRQYAERCGYQVVGEYCDTISGRHKQRRPRSTGSTARGCVYSKIRYGRCLLIDRLGRSLKHCLDILETLREPHRCEFISIKQQIDTSTSGQLIFQIFASLATYERTQILERTALGRERAKARGVDFGRPSKMNSSVAEAVRLLREKGAGIKDICGSLEIGVGNGLQSSQNRRLEGQKAVLQSFRYALDSLFRNTALTRLPPLFLGFSLSLPIM